MHPFMFVINAVPQNKNRHFGTIAQAIVHIWVMDNDMQSAKNRALADINKYLWDPREIEHEFAITDEQLLHLHKDEALLYQKAIVHGISSDYIAAPIVEHPGDPIVLDTPY